MNCIDFLLFCDITGSSPSSFLLHGLNEFGVADMGRHEYCHIYIYNNIFITIPEREKCRLLFDKAQRVRYVLTRAIHRRQVLIAERYCNDDLDMSLGRVMDHPPHHRIMIYTPTMRIYYIGDLLLHWKTQIMNEEYRFPCPRKPTDPFTNIDISSEEFMRVYCAAQIIGFRMHDVLTLLYRSSGDFNRMKARGQMVLKEWALFNYARVDADYHDLYNDLLDIKLSFGQLMDNIHVSRDAPSHVQKAMVDRLRGILIAYSTWAYGENPTMNTENGRHFALKLSSVNEEMESAFYGRVFVVRVNGIRVRKWMI